MDLHLFRDFHGWAQVWRGNERDESLKLLIKSNEHSPNKFRVNGPVSNMPEFWEAFRVRPGDPMRRADKDLVKIW